MPRAVLTDPVTDRARPGSTAHTGPSTGSDREELVARFRAGTLPRGEWTHEAHLRVAWALLEEADGEAHRVIDQLRDLITAYNAHTGSRPDQAACHQTITAYFVRAIAAIGPTSDRALVAHPWCSRRAPLRHWSRALLATEAARRGVVAPDRAPLPWTDRPTTDRPTEP